MQSIALEMICKSTGMDSEDAAFFLQSIAIGERHGPDLTVDGRTMNTHIMGLPSVYTWLTIGCKSEGSLFWNL